MRNEVQRSPVLVPNKMNINEPELVYLLHFTFVEAAHVRKEYEELNVKLSKIQSKVSSLTQKVKHDFGEFMWYMLNMLLLCFSFSFGA